MLDGKAQAAHARTAAAVAIAKQDRDRRRHFPAAAVVERMLRCCMPEQFRVWTGAAPPTLLTPEELLQAFCRDCLPAYRCQMKLSCIHDLDGGDRELQAPSP
jgi:hypothetical protein